MNRNNIKENIKTFLLVVLFATTILLLNLLWNRGNDSFAIYDLIPGKSVDNVPYAYEFIEPEYRIEGNGSGSFNTVRNTDLGAAFEKVGLLAESEELVINEISQEQYISAMSAYYSVQYFMKPVLPFYDVAAIFGVTLSKNLSNIGSFKIIAFSDVAPDSFFVKNSDNKYFRIISGQRLESLKNEIFVKDSQRRTVSYYASDVFGTKSSAIIPISINTAPSYVEAQKEGTGNFEKDAALIAEALFGGSFDFVRKLKDSFGNISYMYGYGSKSLYCGTDGSFEFRTEGGIKQTGFSEDLNTVIEFVVSSGGGWKSLEGDDIALRLSAYEDGDTRKFYFEQKYSSLLCSGNEASIAVEVSGGQVSYYRRAIIEGKSDRRTDEKPIDVVNVIARNCNYMYNMMTSQPLNPNSEEAYGYVTEALDKVSLTYFVNRDRGELVPAWLINMNTGELFYFDLYTASPLAYIEE